MPELLRVETERRGDAVRLALSGELDIASAASLSRETDRALGRQGIQRLLIDLRGLAFMDSTGIRFLVDMATRSHHDGYELLVVKGPPVVHRVLEMTRVDEQLPIIERPEEVGFVTR